MNCTECHPSDKRLACLELLLELLRALLLNEELLLPARELAQAELAGDEEEGAVGPDGEPRARRRRLEGLHLGSDQTYGLRVLGRSS